MGISALLPAIDLFLLQSNMSSDFSLSPRHARLSDTSTECVLRTMMGVDPSAVSHLSVPRILYSSYFPSTVDINDATILVKPPDTLFPPVLTLHLLVLSSWSIELDTRVVYRSPPNGTNAVTRLGLVIGCGRLVIPMVLVHSLDRQIFIFAITG